MKRRRKPFEVENDSSSRFSEKLKSTGSFNERKKEDDSHSYSDAIDVIGKLPQGLYNSGELYLSISRELKPSTQARTPLNKELYHELHALDRFEQDYQRKLEEVDSLHLPQKGESLVMLQSELKHQRKLVKNLKNKSLWSNSLEQIVEKLVDIVTFIHQDISDSFGANDKNDEQMNEEEQEMFWAGDSIKRLKIETLFVLSLFLLYSASANY